MRRIRSLPLFYLLFGLLMTGAFLGQTVFAQVQKLMEDIGQSIHPISTKQEIYAGAQLDKIVREKYVATKNEALQSYVSSVGKKIAEQTHKNYPFSYTVLEDSRTTNAFSGPGGFVYITTGMLNMLENESQLAAVLGHETAHVVKHHVIRQLQAHYAQDLGLLILNDATGVDLNSALTNVGSFLVFQKFSREDEFEADFLGTQLMIKAGYNPKGMVQVLDKLNALESRGVYIAFIQDHPASEARSRVIEEYIERHPDDKSHLKVDSRTFHEVIPTSNR
jgi:beta-barrel assembly-enhancing protease